MEQEKELTKDEKMFGVNAWVYCRDHVKPHKTGWCGVPNSHKVGLGVDNTEEAYEKCRFFDLPLGK